MNNLEKINRQLAKPVSVIIKNEDGVEDEFEFNRLNIEQQAIMVELSKKLEEKGMIIIDGEEVPDVSKEDMAVMENLLINVVKNSMPEIEEATIKKFVNDNFDQLSNMLIKLMPESSKKDKMKLIEERKEAIKNVK